MADASQEWPELASFSLVLTNGEAKTGRSWKELREALGVWYDDSLAPFCADDDVDDSDDRDEPEELELGDEDDDDEGALEDLEDTLARDPRRLRQPGHED